MSLLDTIDGAFMNFAYGWAFSKPVRKVYYNITITGLSVAVALVIGTIELLSCSPTSSAQRRLLGLGRRHRHRRRRLRHRRPVRVTWALALAVWRFGRIEERWAMPAARASSSRRDELHHRGGEADVRCVRARADVPGQRAIRPPGAGPLPSMSSSRARSAADAPAEGAVV